MKIERHYTPTMSIAEFADKYHLTVAVYDRGPLFTGTKERFYAQFNDVEVKEGSCLASAFGNGSNEPEAIQNYAECISEKLLIVNAMTAARREIQAPRLI